MGFSGFRVWGARFRFWGLGLRVRDLGLAVWGLGLGSRLGFRSYGGVLYTFYGLGSGVRWAST